MVVLVARAKGVLMTLSHCRAASREDSRLKE